MKHIILSVLICAAVAMVGCEAPSVPATPVASPDTPNAVPAAAPEIVDIAVEPTPTPASPAQEPPMLNDGDAVLNGSFEEWVEGAPVHWVPLHKVVPSKDVVSVGKTALQTNGGYYYNQITQEIKVDGTLEGKTIVVRCRAKTDKPKTARFFIRITDAYRFDSEFHPGDGEWHELVLEHPVYQLKEDHFQLTLSHVNKPTTPCYYDDVTVTIRDGVPPPPRRQ